MPLNQAGISRLASQDIQVNDRQTKDVMSIAQTVAREKQKVAAYESILGSINFC